MTSQKAARPAFAVNTLWTWASVGANVVMALVVSPLMIFRLGDEAYGLWVLIFSVVEYYTLFDRGIRTAVVKFVAQYWALGEYQELNRTLNTALVSLAAVGACLLVVTLVIAPYGPAFFVISPGLEGTFVTISIIAGVGWALSLLFVAASSSLEAVQRFDLAYRIIIVTNVLRVIVIVSLLQFGFGLIPVVSVAVSTRLVQCLWQYRAFRKHFPQYRWRLGSSIVMVLNRGLLTPYLLCRQLDYPAGKYIMRIAGPPLGAGLVVVAAMWVCRLTWLPGNNLGQIALAGALTTLGFLLLVGRFGVLPGDRAGVLDLVRTRAPFLAGATRRWFGEPA